MTPHRAPKEHGQFPQDCRLGRCLSAGKSLFHGNPIFLSKKSGIPRGVGANQNNVNQKKVSFSFNVLYDLFIEIPVALGIRNFRISAPLHWESRIFLFQPHFSPELQSPELQSWGN